MQNVKFRLDAWREAERRRDGLPPGVPEWQDADDEVRRAETAFHAELAQVSARYAEAEHEDPDWRWFSSLERVTERAEH